MHHHHEVLLAVIAAVVAVTPATSETLLARRPLSAYPKAICNDATSASYYFANATSGSKDYVLYLQGGSVSVLLLFMCKSRN